MTGAMQTEMIDGATVAGAFETASRWLEQHVEAINALNVFPVPDGDTGINMSLTLKAAIANVHAGPMPDTVSGLATAMSRGAIMGARGNSGVILAEIFRGIAQNLGGVATATPAQVSQALAAGAGAAYRAVTNPVEGTILTVSRRAAEAAVGSPPEADLITVLQNALAAAGRAVEDTPNLLAILREAGVVDAGGEGYRIILQGLVMHLRGETLPADPPSVSVWADLSAFHGSDAFGYCTEVLFEGTTMDVEMVRTLATALGSSVLVVGDSEIIKVHVHTPRPGAVVDLATNLGDLLQVKIDNMQTQHRQFAARAASASGSADPSNETLKPGTSVVAVASGQGLEDLFRSLGAIVVSGGMTMNPAVEEIVQAMNSAPTRDVIVLPNNKNVVLVARQAISLLTAHTGQIVATRCVTEGVAALLALNPEADAATNHPRLTEAVEHCHSIEIASATRDADIGDLEIKIGHMMAILDHQPVASEASAAAAVARTLALMDDIAPEAATIYIGADGSSSEAADIAGLIHERFGVQPDVLPGGQPHYPYIISLE